ncbi:MAG: hypothetical protein ACJ746_23880 [Bryobacteraceae bacterium]
MTSPIAPGIDSTRPRNEKTELPGPELVLDQLRRILESSGFRNSKRYAAVLRYIVEQTLGGNAVQLKERTIGVDVFGRTPDYDTATDHVVRSAMAEVRKRLGHYYSETGLSDGLHIEVLPGSYVPQFRMETASVDVFSGPPELVSSPDFLKLKWAVERRTAALVLALLFLVGAALLLRGVFGRNDPLQSFWGPVLNSPRDVLLCIGNLEGGRVPGSGSPPIDFRLLSMGDFHRLPSQTIHVSDAISLANFANLFGSKNKRWRVADQTVTNYSDLRSGPTVLIGLMNNDWTERLVGKVRFRAEKVARRNVVIRDARNPTNDRWSMDYSTPLLEITRDYALVLRVFDPNTDQTVITAAGISVFGTLAASEFLTDARSLSQLNKIAPGWEAKNLEVVLSTEVVRAKSGRPHILAAQVW